MLVMVGWMLIIPPITPAPDGFYIGHDGRPVRVGVEDPPFQWTVYGRYHSAAECEKARSKRDLQSLQMDPTQATAAAYSFAKCIQDDDPRLQLNNGSIEQLPGPTAAQRRRAFFRVLASGSSQAIPSSTRPRDGTTPVAHPCFRILKVDSLSAVKPS
jgi:hypothetical protein